MPQATRFQFEGTKLVASPYTYLYVQNIIIVNCTDIRNYIHYMYTYIRIYVRTYICMQLASAIRSYTYVHMYIHSYNNVDFLYHQLMMNQMMSSL